MNANNSSSHQQSSGGTSSIVTPQSDDNRSSSAMIPAGNAAMDSTRPDMLADLELSLIRGLRRMDRDWDTDAARKKRKSNHGRRMKRDIGDSGSGGEQGGNNSDNSSSSNISIGNNSFGFNFDSDEMTKISNGRLAMGGKGGSSFGGSSGTSSEEDKSKSRTNTSIGGGRSKKAPRVVSTNSSLGSGRHANNRNNGACNGVLLESVGKGALTGMEVSSSNQQQHQTDSSSARALHQQIGSQTSLDTMQQDSPLPSNIKEKLDTSSAELSVISGSQSDTGTTSNDMRNSLPVEVPSKAISNNEGKREIVNSDDNSCNCDPDIKEEPLDQQQVISQASSCSVLVPKTETTVKSSPSFPPLPEPLSQRPRSTSQASADNNSVKGKQTSAGKKLGSGGKGSNSNKNLNEEKRGERNAREKERSFRISCQIDELRNLLSMGGVIVPKGTKSSVLTEAANYIRMLQQHQYRSEMERSQLVQQIQMIGAGALGPQAANAVRHVAAKNGVWSLGNFGGLPPMSSMTVTAPQQQVPSQQAPQSLQQSVSIEDSDFRSIFSSCAAGIAVASMGGGFIDCNKLFSQLSDYNKQELCSLTIFNLTARSDLQNAFDLISSMISPPTTETTEGEEVPPTVSQCTLRGAMKNREDLGLSVSLVRDDNGVAKCFCVTLLKYAPTSFSNGKAKPASYESIRLLTKEEDSFKAQQVSNKIATPAFTAG